jgi:hypothetical protein
MQMNRIKFLLLITISFFISRAVNATSVVESEFEMLLPRQFQQNLIDTFWRNFESREFKFAWDIPDQSYQAPDTKVDLSGINLSIRSFLKKPSVDTGGDSVILESRGLSAALNIKSISIDQVIEREIGGVIGRFRVQAQCENVVLNMKPGAGVFRMTLKPVFRGSLIRAEVESVELSWRTDAWEIGSLNCTGAQGFDDVIREEVLKLTGNSAALIEKYKSVLDKYVEDYVHAQSVDISESHTVASIRPDIKVSLRLTGLDGSRASSLLKGYLHVEFTKAQNRGMISLKLSNSSFSEVVTTGAILRIPEEFVTTVIKQAFVADSFIRRVSSEKIPGFSSLMQSRLTQFVVWPELTRYPKSTEFLFDVSTASNLALSGKDLLYSIQTGLTAQMYAPQGGQYVPFMDFDIPLKSNVRLSVDNGQVKTKFTQVNLDLIGTWEKSYLDRYGAYLRFSRGRIVTRVKQGLEGAESTFKLPQIPVTSRLSFAVDSVKASPRTNDLYIYLTDSEKGVMPE